LYFVSDRRGKVQAEFVRVAHVDNRAVGKLTFLAGRAFDIKNEIEPSTSRKGETPMLKMAALNPLRKLFFVLALLTVVMGSLSSFTIKKAHAMICCSHCETDPVPPACLHGCALDC
jgi:hypothetical protein